MNEVYDLRRRYIIEDKKEKGEYVRAIFPKEKNHFIRVLLILLAITKVYMKAGDDPDYKFMDVTVETFKANRLQ